MPGPRGPRSALVFCSTCSGQPGTRGVDRGAHGERAFGRLLTASSPVQGGRVVSRAGRTWQCHRKSPAKPPGVPDRGPPSPPPLLGPPQDHDQDARRVSTPGAERHSASPPWRQGQAHPSLGFSSESGRLRWDEPQGPDALEGPSTSPPCGQQPVRPLSPPPNRPPRVPPLELAPFAQATSPSCPRPQALSCWLFFYCGNMCWGKKTTRFLCS